MTTFCTGWHREPGFFWVRILGLGLVVKDTARHRLLWSERNRRRWMMRLGRWLVRPLVPWSI